MRVTCFLLSCLKKKIAFISYIFPFLASQSSKKRGERVRVRWFWIRVRVREVGLEGQG